MDRARRLIERLVSDPASSESAGLVYKLLTEYQRGSPVETLRILLHSADDRLAGEGAWIASELSDEGRALLRDVRVLLGHGSRKVRFWAIDCVLLWADSTNGCELAAAAALVDDAEKAVRWKAMVFLALASREQLRAALDQISATNPESPYVDELIWLLDQDGHPEHVVVGLQSRDARRRRVAAAAAFRIAKQDSEPLRYATSVNDPEIVEFAGDMLQRISPS